jgi:hypothetical protein
MSVADFLSNGEQNIAVNDIVIDGKFQLTSGSPMAGYVLVSDSQGVGTFLPNGGPSPGANIVVQNSDPSIAIRDDSANSNGATLSFSGAYPSVPAMTLTQDNLGNGELEVGAATANITILAGTASGNINLIPGTSGAVLTENLNSAGATVLGSSLSVSGATNTASLAVAGSSNLTGALQVSGNSTLQGLTLPLITNLSDLSVNALGVTSAKFPVGAPIPWSNTRRIFATANSNVFYTVPTGSNAIVIGILAYNSGSSNTLDFVMNLPTRAPYGGYPQQVTAAETIASLETLSFSLPIVLLSGSQLLGVAGFGGTAIALAVSIMEFPSSAPLPVPTTLFFGTPYQPLAAGNNILFTNTGTTTQYGINPNAGSESGSPFSLTTPSINIINDGGATCTYITSITPVATGTPVVFDQATLENGQSATVTLPLMIPGDILTLNCSEADPGDVFVNLCAF